MYCFYWPYPDRGRPIRFIRDRRYKLYAGGRLFDVAQDPLEQSPLPQSGDDAWFYFLHSYALPVSAHTIAIAEHADSFSAVIAHENFVAAQFHPERSSGAGARLLGSFLGGSA